MNKFTIYGAALAGGLGVATVAVDGYTTALDPTHNDQQTFALVVSSSAAAIAQTVQHMVLGDLFEVVEPEQVRSRLFGLST